MSFSPPSDPPSSPGATPGLGPDDGGQPGRRRRSPLVITLLVVAVLVILLLIASEVWTEFLWFDQLGFTRTLLTRWGTQVALFVIGFALFAIPLHLGLRLGHKRRPVYPPITREQEAVDRFRQAIDPLRRGLTIVAPLVLGGFGGLAAAQQWQSAQLFLHPQSFQKTDPIFGLDVGFFVFTLPMIDQALTFVQFALFTALIGTVASHVVYGGLAWTQEDGLRTTRAARMHLAVLGAAYVLLVGVGHWFNRYNLLTSPHDRFHGANYTEANVLIPAQTILAIAAVVVAALFLLWIWRSDWRVPAIGAGLMIISTLVVGSAIPALIQQFRVQPNERALEQPYIQHNIEATRSAYGLDSVEEISYAASVNAEAGALREDTETTAQLRLMDPAVVSPTFEQREANRRYWGFDDVLSVDRYTVDGQMQDTVLGVRELRPDQFDLAGQPWVNQHVIYTHGYGVAAAYGNRRNSDGEPSFLQSGVPGDGALGDFEERVYFGRHSPDYSIVGAPEGADPQEFDYQAGTGEEQSAAQVTNTFRGDGGPSIGSPLNRLLYAVKFRDPNILISNYVNSESQILYDRDPQERVREVAPFLSLDSQVYPAVVDGRLLWVVDGYTTTDRYPYSRTLDLNQTTRDSTTNPAESTDLRVARTNYLRNGVKATVDAFDGSVTLYAWDTEDPILKAWQEVFPSAVKPASDISPELMGHMRYPADLFKAQREALATYHVTDPVEFFGQQDFWQVPPDPTKPAPENADGTAGAQPPQPPMYLTMQAPGMDSARFTLSSSYIPAQGEGGRNVLTGMLIADSETGRNAGNPAATFGELRLLVLPATNPVNGPGQVQAAFNSEPNVSQALNLLRSGNSEVINGNLLTVPVGGGLMYVQPVYLQSSASGGGTQYPLLQMVLVSFGDKIGFAPTLDQALDEVFAGDSGAAAGDASVQTSGVAGSANTETGTGSAEQVGPGESPPQAAPPGEEPAQQSAQQESGDAQARLDQALADADQAVKDGQAAMREGDWAAYGEAQERLDEALGRATAANEELGGAAASDGGGEG